MRVAALDLGSNTFLLLVAEVEGGRIRRILADETRVTKLGQGVQASGEFHRDALLRADSCLSEYQKIIADLQAEKIVAVATSAARDVKNGSALLELGKKYGLPIQVIPGDLEAEVTYLGATADLGEEVGTAVIDVGGGSAEVIGRDVSGRLRGVSIDVGSVRLTEKLITRHPCSPGEIKSMEEYIREQFRLHRARLPEPVREVIAVAGTPTTLVMLEEETEYNEAKIHGQRLTLETIFAWRNRLAEMSVPDRQRLPGMPSGRAEVLVAGATILALACEALGVSEVTVSVRGVRFGLLLKQGMF